MTIPPRTATDDYFRRANDAGGVRRNLDIEFDVDLGELARGHRVVARGLELTRGGAALHYEFVPGGVDNVMRAYWLLRAEDDVGTTYSDYNGGAFSPASGEAAHGTRDIGGAVPEAATCVRLHFTPAQGWTPDEPWCRALAINLRTGEVHAHTAPA